ncbi:MAG: hypothetical protein NC205_05400 [Prevotella sp.]|nr:hypothetical protein [Alistipes senegalensis]MCM1358011.1 hypothetical protein [Prevotella sp.]MCM1474461.1 hypothetical protein [Muribaculaceae bacterium]MDE6425401.1 hypothetical protein [Ruminococcus sp.]
MNKNVKKKSKNLKRPKVKFNFGVLLVIFLLSFTACFALYMTAANLNEDFFRNEFNAAMIIDTSESSETEESSEENTDAEISEQEEQPIQKAPVTNPVPQSAAADYTYFENCCLITDSTLLEMGEYTALKDIIGDSSLNASNCITAKVESNYGAVTIYDTLKIKKPENVYFMLGSDIGTSETETMIAGYKELISNLTASLPAMNIYVMQIPPVRYDAAPVTNELINTYNEQLLAMANSCNVHCIDTSTALKSVDGNLKEEYWSAEEKKFTEDMYKAVTEYIITHVA